VLGGLFPLIFGLALAGFGYWECLNPRTKSPENDRRQLFYDKLWVWPIKAETPAGRRKWNGLAFITAGFVFMGVGLVLLFLNPG
jgi:hypothetical protein